MLDKEELDFDVDPPPDLVIEVGIASSSPDRFPIFAAVGIPEVWRYHNEEVRIHLLHGDRYSAASTSAALPPVTAAVLTQFVQQARRQPSTRWSKEVKQWAQSARI